MQQCSLDELVPTITSRISLRDRLAVCVCGVPYTVSCKLGHEDFKLLKAKRAREVQPVLLGEYGSEAWAILQERWCLL